MPTTSFDASLRRLLLTLLLGLGWALVAPSCTCDSAAGGPPVVCTGEDCACSEEVPCALGYLCVEGACAAAGTNNTNNPDDGDAGVSDAAPNDAEDNNGSSDKDAPDPEDVEDGSQGGSDAAEDAAEADAPDTSDTGDTGITADVNTEDAPATCIDDTQEPNDTAALAFPIPSDGTELELRTCGDEDWFTLDAPVGQTLTATLTQTPADLGGALAVELRDAQSNVLATADALVPTLRYEVTTAATLWLRVVPSAARGAYVLSARLQPTAPLCPDDSREPDSTPAQASALTAGAPVALTLCPDDTDWLRFTGQANSQARVTLQGAADVGLRADLIDPTTNTTISIFSAAADGGAARAILPADGDYLVRVSAPAGQGTDYTLTLAQDACLPDGLEPNDTAAQASTPAIGPLYDDLRICQGDVDWHRFPDLLPGQTVNVTLTRLEGSGTLTARWYRNGNTTTPIQTTGIVDEGGTLALYAPSGGDVLLQISGNTPLRAYSLRAELDAACLADALEPNDDPAEASINLLGTGVIPDLSICSDDLDFHCAMVPAGQLFVAAATFEHDDGDLELQIVTTQGLPLGASSTNNDTERAQYLNVTAQPVVVCAFVLATGFDPFIENTYTLDLAIGSALTCVEDALEDNDGPENASLLRDRRDTPTAPIPSGLIFSNPASTDAINPLRGLKICGGDPDAFRFSALPGDTVEVDLQFLHSAGNLDLEVFRLTGLTSVGAATSLTDDETLTFTAADEDEYIALVTGPGVANQAYSLGVRLSGACFDDPREPNESRAAASPLPLGLTRDIAACAGDNDWYAISLQPGDTLDLAITYRAWRTNLNLDLVAPSGTVIGRSNTLGDRDAVTFTAATPGTYYVHVYAEDTTVHTTYDLAAARTPANLACPADRLEPSDATPVPVAFNPAGARLEGLTLCYNDTDRLTFSLLNSAPLEVVVSVPFTTPNSAVTLTAPGGATTTPTAVPGGRRFTIANAPAGAWTLEIARAEGGPPRVDYAVALSAAPDRCLEDLYAPNDDPTTAANAGLGTLDGLTLCGQTRDCFLLPVEAGDDLRVQALYDRRQGDLLLRLYGPDLQLAASSNNATQAETILIEDAAPGDWVACVNAVRALTPEVRYDLLLSASAACDDPITNTDATRARELPLETTLPVRSCGGSDWYVLRSTPGLTLQLTTTWPNGPAAPTIRLFNGALEPIDSRTGGPGGATLLGSSATGILLLQVELPPGTPLDYALYAALPASTPDCAAPEGGGDTPATAASITLNTTRTAHLCDAADLYSLNVVAGDAIDVALTFDPAHGQPILEVLDAPGERVLSTGRAFRNTTTASLTATRSGAVLLRVRPDERYVGPYALTPTLRQPRGLCGFDANEPDNTDADATLLGAPQGQRTGSLCNTDTDTYALPLQAGERLDIDLGLPRGLTAALTVLSPGGATLTSATPVAGEPHAAASILAAQSGVYLLRLTSPSNLRYDLQWRISPDGLACTDDSREPNDVAAAAASIPNIASLDLQACPANDDYFQLQISAGDTLHLLLQHAPGDDDLDLELLDATNNRLAASARLRDREELTFTAINTTNVRVHVIHRGHRPTPYSLGVLTTTR